MDSQSAISRLNLLFSDASDENYPFTEVYGQAVATAIRALEKQTARKVMIVGHNNAMNKDVGNCPYCDELLLEGCRYCYECGQKLLWGD